MAEETTPADRPGTGSDTLPPALRWLLPALTVLLAALAVWQVVNFAPKCVYVAQRLGVQHPGQLNLLMSIPEWLAMAAGLVLAGLAIWHRGSVGRAALLATVAVAVNVGLLFCVLGSLFKMVSVLSRA